LTQQIFKHRHGVNRSWSDFLEGLERTRIASTARLP
jgi:hypothetical protein